MLSAPSPQLSCRPRIISDLAQLQHIKDILYSLSCPTHGLLTTDLLVITIQHTMHDYIQPLCLLFPKLLIHSVHSLA
jgi:hypothetical protein